MATKKTLEQVYFHINNGGISFTIIEKLDVRKSVVSPPSQLGPELCEHANEVPGTCPCPDNCYCRRQGTCSRLPEPSWKDLPTEKVYNRRWVFRVSTSHFGSGVKFEFPLVPHIIRWTQEALARVLVRMETPTGLKTDGFEYALREEKLPWAVSARDGNKVDEYWPFPRESKEDGST